MEDFAGNSIGRAEDSQQPTQGSISDVGDSAGLYPGAELGGPKYYGSTVPALGQHASNEVVHVGPQDEHGKFHKVVRVASGVVTLLLGAVSIAFEQLPTNERWRISAGLKELVRTGNPAAVAREVGKITMEIESVSSALVILALYSNNPIVEKPKHAFNRWMDTGAQRADFRAELKEEEKAYQLKVENNWRVAQSKDPKLTKQEKIEQKEDEFRVKNNWRILQSKKPKLTPAEKLEKKNLKRDSKGKGPIKAEDTLLKRVNGFVGRELTDLLLANGLGAGIVVFKNAMSGRSKSVKESIIDAAKATLEISAVSSAIGYLIASGTAKAKFGLPFTDSTVHYEQQAQWLIDYGTNTKALMAILLAAYTPGTLIKLYHRLPKQDAKFKEWLESQLEKTSDSNTELAYT